MKFVVAATIMLQVLAVGVQTNPANLLICVRRTLWLVRIVAAMFIAVPLLAVALVKMSSIPISVKAAMLVMAIAAVAPLLPRKLLKLGIDAAFAESLSAVTMVLAIPLVPITAAALGAIFGREAVVSPASVAGTLASTFLLPLAVGIALKAVLGARAERLGEWANTVSTIAIAAIVLLMLVAQRGGVFPLLWRSLPVIALFAAGSLLIGHVLGGPDPEERTALAIATVTRHPGLAVLIATTSLPELHLLPAILALILGSAIVAIPYMAWRKHSLAARPSPSAPAAGVR